jgi:hypothetical protein
MNRLWIETGKAQRTRSLRVLIPSSSHSNFRATIGEFQQLRSQPAIRMVHHVRYAGRTRIAASTITFANIMPSESKPTKLSSARKQLGAHAVFHNKKEYRFSP